MVDLGDYAAEVISAYVISLALIAVLVAVSVASWRRAKRQLEEVERRHG